MRGSAVCMYVRHKYLSKEATVWSSMRQFHLVPLDTCQPREVRSLDRLTKIPGFQSKSLDTPPPKFKHASACITCLQKSFSSPDKNVLCKTDFIVIFIIGVKKSARKSAKMVVITRHMWLNISTLDQTRISFNVLPQ